MSDEGKITGKRIKKERKKETNRKRKR